MTAAPPTGLRVLADLHLDVDGVEARITGDGDRIDVRTDHPRALARAMLLGAAPASWGSAGRRRVLVRAAELLDDAALTVTVTGPRGPIAMAGRGVSSRVGRAVAGTSHVALTSGLGRRTRVGAVVVGIVAVLVGVLRRRR